MFFMYVRESDLPWRDPSTISGITRLRLALYEDRENQAAWEWPLYKYFDEWTLTDDGRGLMMLYGHICSLCSATRGKDSLLPHYNPDTWWLHSCVD